MPKEKLVLGIRGMHCAICAQTIEENLNKLPSVKANVNFALEKAFVEYDSEKVDVDRIKKAIRDAGYDVLEESKEIEGMRKANLKISRRDNRSAEIVERALRKIEGVLDVKTEFAFERVVITFDPKKK
ncbi:MAG: P-type Cu+ transporter [Archaeoglobaceae archaeon]|nr:P-type Cu+ transporter [Archaeoglobaceae archaeon]